MKQLLIAVAACTLLAACGPKSADAPAPVATAPATAPVAAPPPPVSTVETGDAFATPLPGGVVAPLPYHARVDEQTTNAKGVVGRRTEYEFLEGNAAEAMAKFATAAAAAGFRTKEGPTVDDKGIIRQVFTKAGYGAVFVRAQNLGPKFRKHPKAHGVIAVAWPRQDAAQPVVAN